MCFFFSHNLLEDQFFVNLDTVMLFHGFNLNVSCYSWKHMINGTDLFVAKTDDILHALEI